MPTNITMLVLHDLLVDFARAQVAGSDDDAYATAIEKATAGLGIGDGPGITALLVACLDVLCEHEGLTLANGPRFEWGDPID